VKGPKDLFYCDCGSGEFGCDLKEPTICKALPKDFVMPPMINTKLSSTTTLTAPATTTVTKGGDGKKDVSYCTICTQVAVRPVTPNGCDHIACLSCITTWASTRLSCPLCKHQFTSLLDHLNAKGGEPLVIPITVMNQGRLAKVAWRVVFKEQWIRERNDAVGWGKYVRPLFRRCFHMIV
jgi:hypothetical protein